MRAIVTDADVLGGDPRLNGTRIGVAHIHRRYEGGETPEAIAAGYGGVSVADVHAALAYAFDDPETYGRSSVVLGMQSNTSARSARSIRKSSSSAPGCGF